MSDYKLTFKLKYHTPIIHFQYDVNKLTNKLSPKLGRLQNENIDYNQNILYYCKSIDYNRQNIAE